MKENGNGFSAGCLFFSFLAGGIVGAGAALLLAPQSGEETRKKIKETAEITVDKAEGLFSQAKHTAESAVEKGKKLLEEKKTIIETAYEAGKEAYQKEKEKLSTPR